MFGPINLVSHLILIYFKYKHIRRSDPTSKHWFLKHFNIKPPYDKTNKMTVRPAKTQISLGIRPVWSESSLCAQWVAKDPSFLHADSEDSDQTGRMPMLIWVFAGAHISFCWFCHEAAQLFQLLWFFVKLKYINWAITWDYGTFRPV